MSASAELRCGTCAAAIALEDRFCEQCGAPAAAADSAQGGCLSCGAPAAAVGEDGYCTVCGVLRRPAAERAELDLVVAAAVSDQGRVHQRNEDAFDLQLVADRGVAAVVCDGVSSASAGDTAAQAAARAAGAVLAAAIGDPGRDPSDATVAAIGAAHDAVAQVPWTTRVDRAVPSCTLVSALWRGSELVVGWIGDSRAYWLEGGRCRPLTVDDSWAEEQVAEGLLSREEAARDRRFHSITHWVGADAPDRPPRVVALTPEAPGRLVLCTDGLWNYAPSAEELGALIEALPAGAGPAAVARSLTETALARGGRDNITVAVVDIDPVREP
ncbi:MAG TPA: PP2C family serine/threonine-protein phosphatase [Solirubrobacteraceae bacterium]|nr:PP2C family serine/threonine-protein phosphatase [Solirubrobacteraceae bacterium]